MIDPLDALRLPGVPVEPRAGFAGEVSERIHRAVVAGPALLPAPVEVPSTDPRDYDALDEALELIAGTGPEFDPFGTGFCLTNHVPMVAEALCALGRPDAVRPWTDHFRRYLGPVPAPRETLTSTSWADALGHLDRMGDWQPFFEAELDRDAWIDVLNRWFPRLAPATVAVHGVLRVAHAVRAMGEHETPPRRRDLAQALGYWAALYHTFPDTPGRRAGLRPGDAFALIEQPPVEDRETWMLFTELVTSTAHLGSFATACDLVDLDRDPGEFLSDLTEAYAAMLVTNACRSRGIVHGFTAGSATRMMLPYLTDTNVRLSLRYGWQIAAAFYGGFKIEDPATQPEIPECTIDELIATALTSPDEHGIKITEACLREYRVNPKPVYLAAAHASLQDLARTGLDLDTWAAYARSRDAGPS
jgi:hypothetical protein